MKENKVNHLGHINKHNDFDQSYFNSKKEEFPVREYCEDANRILKISEKGFFSDLKTFSFLIDWLRHENLLKKWTKHLDIGGAEGFHASFFKLFNITKKSYNLDIRHFEINYFKRIVYYYKFILKNFLYKIFNLKIKDNKFGFLLEKNSVIFNCPIFKIPKFDGYLEEKDFYKINDKYDLLTSFLSFGYFDYEQFFKKSAEILENGGNLIILCSYWWYPVNTQRIYGATPFASQIFNYDQLLDHYEKYFPEKKKYLRSAINNFHKGKKPVLDDYIISAKKNNLSLLSYKRITPNLSNSKRTSYTINKMLKKKIDLTEILKKININYPKVRYEDMYTGWLLLFFEKD